MAMNLFDIKHTRNLPVARFWAWGLLLLVGISFPVTGEEPADGEKDSLQTNPALKGPDTIVVCPSAFMPALRPWLDYRRKQGHRFAFVSNLKSESQICESIKVIAKSGTVKAVVLVGDVPSGRLDHQKRMVTVPTRRVPAKVNVHFGGSKDIASDNGYADLDGDQLPDLAIGRLPADSVAELETMLEKVMRFERSTANDWKNRINVVAGVGGFGFAIDSVLDLVTRKFLADGIPSSYGASMTFASWQSPFCPDPRMFGDQAIARFNDGCLFWVYVGHGQPYALDEVRVPNAQYPILRIPDIDKMNRRGSSPIALMLACHTCAFDLQRDCIAEAMVRSKGGPVAVIGGSRVTMPYAMSLLTNSMMDHYFGRGIDRLGDLVKLGKRQMILSGEFSSPQRKKNETLAISLAKLLSPNRQLLKEERYEHLWNFNLIGDPLMRVHQPKPIEIKLAGSALAGQKLRLRVESPIRGKCRLSLITRRDRMKHTLNKRRAYDASSKALEEYTPVYKLANDRLIHQVAVELTKGQQFVEVAIPAGANGPHYLRLECLSGDFAVGGTDVVISPAD